MATPGRRGPIAAPRSPQRRPRARSRASSRTAIAPDDLAADDVALWRAGWAALRAPRRSLDRAPDRRARDRGGARSCRYRPRRYRHGSRRRAARPRPGVPARRGRRRALCRCRCRGCRARGRRDFHDVRSDRRARGGAVAVPVGRSARAPASCPRCARPRWSGADSGSWFTSLRSPEPGDRGSPYAIRALSRRRWLGGELPRRFARCRKPAPRTSGRDPALPSESAAARSVQRVNRLGSPGSRIHSRGRKSNASLGPAGAQAAGAARRSPRR